MTTIDTRQSAVVDRADTLATMVRVARLHLVDRLSYTVLPWGILAFTFAVNIVIFALIPTPPPEGFFTGGLLSIYVFLVIVGVMSMTKTVPFAFTLGVSRRTYYLGTVGLAVATSALWAVLLTVLWAVEGWTNGWGLNMHFFRVPWLLDGPWYQVLLTSFVALSMMFLGGMWYGLTHRRWGVPGVIVLSAGLVLLALGWAVLVTLTGTWPEVGRFMADLDILGATGIVALVAVFLGFGGYVTIRRITV